MMNETSKTAFFRYPTANGFKYAGFEHSAIETTNAYIAHQASAIVAAIEDDKEEWAFDTLLDSIDELHCFGLFTIESAACLMNNAIILEQDNRRAMRNDGTMDALVHHTQVSDYPTPRF